MNQSHRHVISAATAACSLSRRRILHGALATAAPLLAACGAGPAGQPAPAAQGKVVFMSQAATQQDTDRYKPLVEQFNARRGPVTIDFLQNADGGGAAETQAKMLTLTAAGTPPDVYWTHAYISPNLIKLGIAGDVAPWIKKDKDFKLGTLFEAAVKDYATDDGRQFGLPLVATTVIVIVNKQLFQKNGVALPPETWTWDDYLRIAQQLTKGDGTEKTWGAAGWGGQGSSSYLAPIKAWQEGGDIVDKTRTKFTLHQSPAVEQMQWLADLIVRHRVHPYADTFPGSNITESWNSGRLGMVTQISSYGSFAKAQFEWDILHLPRGKNRVTRTASAGHSVAAGSKNRDAAWEVLKFLASKPAFEHWAKTGLTVPTHKEVAASPLVFDPNLPPKNAKIALDAFAYARPEPIAGDWSAVQSEFGKAMNDVYAGKTDARTALTAIVAVEEALLAKTPDRK